MCETVFSTIKRTLGDAVRARTWYGEFRELVFVCGSQHQAISKTVKSSYVWRFTTARETEES